MTSNHAGPSTNTPSALTLDIHKKLNQAQHSGQGWNQLWADGATPWNLGQSAPPLRDLFSKDSLPMLLNHGRSQLRCLVPGCGEGYDVIFLAQQEQVANVCGLEISQLAVDKIQKRVSSIESAEQAKITLILQDFFTLDAQRHKFNFVFDYTFYCAILPSLRPQWARKMSELIEPHGLLVTLIFPIGDFENGPPFAVNFEGYKQLLEQDFELLKGPYDSASTVKARQGREQVAIWQRRSAAANHRL